MTKNGNYIGWKGQGDVSCPPTANKNFGCFSGFFASLDTALFSTANYFQFMNQQTGVPAATILSSYYKAGLSVTSAFDALAHAGYTPDAGYGAAVATRDGQVLTVENCLRQDGIIH